MTETTESLSDAPPRPSTPRDRRMAPFIAVAMSIIVGVHLFVGWRLFGTLGLETPSGALAWGVLALSAALIPSGLLGRFFLRPALADGLAWLGLTMMGFMSFLLVGTFLRDIALLVLKFLPDEGGVTRADLVSGGGLALLPISAVFSAVGYFYARRLPPIVRVPVVVAGLDPRLEGLRIVQLSDVHIGPTIKRSHIERLVALVNGLDADIVAITGDLVDGSVAALRDDAAPVENLRSHHGTFFVTGNHEYYAGVEAWVAELRRLGLTVLRNEHRVLTHAGAHLVVAGVDDYNAPRMGATNRSDPAAAVAGAPVGLFRLLLAHQPRSAFAAAEAGVDLQLSGHTHGGQFVPWNLFVPLQQPFTHSLRRLGKLQIYTSRGTGYWGPPVRLGAPSEITLLTLTSGHAA